MHMNYSIDINDNVYLDTTTKRVFMPLQYTAVLCIDL